MLIDETLLRFDNIWAAAGTPNAVFRLTPADLVALTGGLLWMWRMADRVLSLSITRADAAVQEEICNAAQGSKMRGFGAR